MLLPETIRNCIRFFAMHWASTLSSREGFYMIIDTMKLLASVDNMVLIQDTSTSLIPISSLYEGLTGSIKLGKEGR